MKASLLSSVEPLHHTTDTRAGPNQEIEVLRAVAVLFVLLHHYPALLGNLPLPWHLNVEGLWSGVDLFFCISGYVIARGLIPELMHTTGTQFWRAVFAFWIKRWYRIIPAAWLWILALVAYNGLGILTRNSDFLFDAMAAVLHYANINFYLCTVGLANHCQNLHVYWSLSLEEQFYLLIPLVIFLVRQRLGMVMLVLALAQMFVVRHHWQGLLAFIRTDAIALGVLLAVVSFQPLYQTIRPRWLDQGAGGVLAMALVAGIAWVTTVKPIELYMGLMALLCLLLVWLASYNCGYVMRPGRVRGWLVAIGQRSFSIYLAHIVAFATAKSIVNTSWFAHPFFVAHSVVLLVCVGTVVLTVFVELSYRLVEKPWRSRGRIVAQRFANGGRDLLLNTHHTHPFPH